MTTTFANHWRVFLRAVTAAIVIHLNDSVKPLVHEADPVFASTSVSLGHVEEVGLASKLVVVGRTLEFLHINN